LKQQKIQREAEEQARTRESQSYNDAAPPAFPENEKAPLLPPFPGPAANAPNYEAKSPVEISKDKEQGSGLMGSFKRLMRQESKSKIQSPQGPVATPTPPMMGISETGVTTKPKSGGMMGQGNTVSSPAAINANVRQALMACKPTNASLLQNRTEMNVRCMFVSR
jgi:hypothetical protein